MSPIPEHSDRSSTAKHAKFWVLLSIFLSTGLLVWAFSLPFRAAGKPFFSAAKSPEGTTPRDWVAEAKQRRTNAEEFRSAAIALDREFMRKVQAKNQANNEQTLPGAEQVKRHWERRIELVHNQLRELADVEKDSPEWQYKQTLLSSLADGPH